MRLLRGFDWRGLWLESGNFNQRWTFLVVHYVPRICLTTKFSNRRVRGDRREKIYRIPLRTLRLCGEMFSSLPTLPGQLRSLAPVTSSRSECPCRCGRSRAERTAPRYLQLPRDVA